MTWEVNVCLCPATCEIKISWNYLSHRVMHLKASRLQRDARRETARSRLTVARQDLRLGYFANSLASEGLALVNW